MINKLLQFLSDYFLNLLLGYEKWQVERKLGATRSPLWGKTKGLFEREHPKICSVCETKIAVELHHEKPFYLRADLENDLNNLIWLCRQHHYLFGHLLKWASFNENVRIDSKSFHDKILQRP